MTYFNGKDIAAISMSGVVWAIINAFTGPIFWNATHLPFLCDMIGFLSLILVVWWTKKFGAASFTGLIATLVNFAVRGAGFFLGFTVASIAFDIFTRVVGYRNLFSKPHIGPALMIVLAAVAAFIAGLIIGPVFTGLNVLGAILIFASLHGIGGVLGGILGVSLVKALMIRKVMPNTGN